MNNTSKQRLLGLRALLEDVVEHGSSAVERVHRETAERTFAVLEAIPPVAAPARPPSSTAGRPPNAARRR